MSGARGELIAFYGTLLGRYPTQDRLGLRSSLSYQGECRIWGQLVDLGDYPGLIAGRSAIFGEIYRILDPDALEVLDQFECYNPSDPPGSEYLRQQVELAQPKVKAWVYRFAWPPRGLEPIAATSWPEHLSTRESSDWETFFASRPGGAR